MDQPESILDHPGVTVGVVIAVVIMLILLAVVLAVVLKLRVGKPSNAPDQPSVRSQQSNGSEEGAQTCLLYTSPSPRD